MSAILDDDEDVLAGLEKGERTVVVNPRELALQAIADGRIREFETESGLKVPALTGAARDRRGHGPRRRGGGAGARAAGGGRGRHGGPIQV